MQPEIIYKDNASALRALTNCLLGSASEDGLWHDFDGSWDPIITTIAAEFLLNAGLRNEDKWYVHRDVYKPVTLRLVFKYLDHRIGSDGTLGTDFWDAARLGKLIISKELRNHFTNFDKLNGYLLRTIETNSLLGRDSEWRGPGFYAAAVDYLEAAKLDTLSAKNLDSLLFFQEQDGSWVGEKSKEGHPTVSPVWHTAQALMTLKRIDPTKYSKQIERGMQWLQQTQEDDGSWPSLRQYKIYFTSYAILALSDSPYTKEVKWAEDFLKGKIDDHGKCSDLGGTLMCALAFWELTKEQLQHSISFMDYVLSTNNSSITNSLEGQIRELTSQVSAKDEIIKDYRERYKDADFVVSKRQLLVVALASLFITTLSLVLGIYGIKLAVGTSPNNRPVLDTHQSVPESTASPNSRPGAVTRPTGTPTK